ncbi:MAG: hypothetical protein AAF570_26710, partial [Bacteroidota bacterium]
MIKLTATQEIPRRFAFTWDKDAHRTRVALSFISFLDASLTGTARATFYNTAEEQKTVFRAVHHRLLKEDRGLYMMGLLLPGITDYARQTGVFTLLKYARKPFERFPLAQENAVIAHLLKNLPTHRMLNTFLMLRQDRVNNARTRKIILRTLLNSPRLQFQAVRYRRKIRRSLSHAWGNRHSSILNNILRKQRPASHPRELRYLSDHINRFVEDPEKLPYVHECLKFILGNLAGLSLPYLVAYRDARKNLKAGARLPYEVLEGIRSRFHKQNTSANVLALTREALTKGQKIRLQNKAAEAGVTVEFDPKKYDPVRLYIYAYRMGLSLEIDEALTQKARTDEWMIVNVILIAILAFFWIASLLSGSAYQFSDVLAYLNGQDEVDNLLAWT